MIPKIIHCCWFGGPKTPLARQCLASWRFFAPDWEIREWDLGEIRARLASRSDSVSAAFFDKAIEAGKWAMASDWLRMFALHEEGGVYFDFDVELVAPFTGLPDCEWVAGEHTAVGDVWMASGAGIALEKGSSVARAMLEEYSSLDFDPDREMMPWINERLSEFPLRVLDPEIMCPIGVDGRCHASGRTIAVHRYAMSWASPRQRVLRWMSWHGMRPAIDALLSVRRVIRRFFRSGNGGGAG